MNFTVFVSWSFALKDFVKVRLRPTRSNETAPERVSEFEMFLVLVPPPSPRRRLTPPRRAFHGPPPVAALLVLDAVLPTFDAALPFSTPRSLLSSAPPFCPPRYRAPPRHRDIADIAFFKRCAPPALVVPCSPTNREALTVNTVQPTNPPTRTTSGATLANLASVHDVARRACEVVSVRVHALCTVYIDSNDTQLLPIRCSTVDSNVLVPWHTLPEFPIDFPNTNALDCKYTALMMLGRVFSGGRQRRVGGGE
ncbi:hypothetical protein B0H11DRAFT_1936122 [Mycena galericulata]|nr:hypothetical protein B0H11DRAFT_1936122 [Mycena galericulata]